MDAEIPDAHVAFRPHRRRTQKRTILRDYQIRIRVAKAPKIQGKRSKPEDVSMRIGGFRDDFSIYK